MVDKIKRLVCDHRWRPCVNKSEVDSYAEAGALMDDAACSASCGGGVRTKSARHRLAQRSKWD